MADPAKWTELVRTAYRSYNAAIVSAIKQVRKLPTATEHPIATAPARSARRSRRGGPSKHGGASLIRLGYSRALDISAFAHRAMARRAFPLPRVALGNSTSDSPNS